MNLSKKGMKMRWGEERLTNKKQINSKRLLRKKSTPFYKHSLDNPIHKSTTIRPIFWRRDTTNETHDWF